MFVKRPRTRTGNGSTPNIEGPTASLRNLNELRRYREGISEKWDEGNSAWVEHRRANRLAQMQHERDKSICSECGAKAWYWMLGKRYCKTHIAIGKQLYAKKWGHA